MANIALNKPSGGQLILSPEDGTSTETVTIPSVGVGKVLQVVRVAVPYTTTPSVTSGSWTSSGVAASITPTSSTSKILVMVNGVIGTSNSIPMATILRSGPANAWGYNKGAYIRPQADYSWANNSWPFSMSWYDSPATTSEVTYTIMLANGGANTTYLNRSGAGEEGGDTAITVMEVAA